MKLLHEQDFQLYIYLELKQNLIIWPSAEEKNWSNNLKTYNIVKHHFLFIPNPTKSDRFDKSDNENKSDNTHNQYYHQ